MYHPYCKRCLSKNNLGQETCGSCNIKITVARAFNTAIDFCKGNKKRASQYLGFQNRSSFYSLSQSIPEVSQAWESFEGKPQDEPKKILGTKVMNKATLTEIRIWKKVLRIYEYHQMGEKKQHELVEWFHSDSARTTRGL